jgi:hypothetical protein
MVAHPNMKVLPTFH